VANDCALRCTKELLSVVPNIDNKIEAYFKRKEYETLNKPVFKICEKIEWPKAARNRDQLIDLLICAYTQKIENDDKYKERLF